MTAPTGPASGARARAERLGREPTATPPGRPGPPDGREESEPFLASERPDQIDQPGQTLGELDPDALAALEEQRAFLLTSLRDLEAEHDAGDVDDADYEALKDDYTARAAVVMRAIDSHHVQVRARRRRPSWGRRLGWVAVVVALAVGAGVAVAHSAGQRRPGDTITGGTPQGARDQLLAARQLQAEGKYTDAVKAYDQVLAQDPANVEALAYRGWMLRLVALSAQGPDRQLLQTNALQYLERARQADPTDGTTLVFLAVLYGDLGRPQEALSTLDQVPAGGVPDFMTGTVDSFREQLRAQLAASGSSTTSTP